MQAADDNDSGPLVEATAGHWWTSSSLPKVTLLRGTFQWSDSTPSVVNTNGRLVACM